MKSLHRTCALALALGTLASGAQVLAQSANNEATNPSSTTTQREADRGVPGVDVDVNRSRNDRGVPGVDASVGAEGDQRNVDTRTSGAGSAPATRAGSDLASPAPRADRN